MRLKAADIDRIMEANVPKPPRAISSNDYVEQNAAAQDQLLRALASAQNSSTARQGEVLPLAPPSLKVIQSNNSHTALQSPIRPALGRTTTTGSEREGADEATFNPDPDPDSILFGEAERNQEVLIPEEVSRPPLPLALRNVNLDKIECRADLIRGLTSNLPMNEMGLPKILYRGDLIDWHLFVGSTPVDQDPTDRYKEMQDYLDAATIHLDYTQGFPALPTGEALWARLPFEPSDHYAAFTEYCTLVGVRETSKLNLPNIAHQTILQWFHEDYWSIRVKCFDMLQQVHAAKQREQRILHCDDNHYKQADKILSKLTSMIGEVDFDSLKAEPEKFVNTLERVAKLQRQILGLTSANGSTSELKTESVEVAMKRLATQDIQAMKEDDSVDVRQLLRSPGALASAQELVIRMTQTTQRRHQDASTND